MPRMRTSPYSLSANFALKLSEKGSEQRSEHGFGQYSGAKTGRKVPFGCLMRPRPGHLRDFSDSFLTAFSEVYSKRVLCSPEACVLQKLLFPPHALQKLLRLREKLVEKPRDKVDGIECDPYGGTHSGEETMEPIAEAPKTSTSRGRWVRCPTGAELLSAARMVASRYFISVLIMLFTTSG
jgi:hypothetical protein